MAPRWAAAALALALVAPGLAQERPLPEVEPFLREVRKHLQPDDSRQGGYMFMVTERTVKYDGRGRPTSEASTVSESYPGLGPGEPRWERVLEKNGVRVPETTVRRKDAERRKQAETYALRLQNPNERQKLARARERDLREAADLVDDVFRVYDLAMLGREVVDGHETIVFSLTPRPSARPRTREGKWLRAFRGRAWISESDYELVKLDVEAIDSVSIGLGMVARMHKGTTATFSRRKVNGEIWLPARAEYRYSARVLLLKSMREGGTVTFSNYRKFGVETSTTIAPPAGG